MIVKKWLPWIFIAIIAAIVLISKSFGQDYYDPPPPAQEQKKIEPKISAPEHPLVEIMVSIDRLKFVGEQNIVLKAEIVFYQQINPFWEGLAKINFSPFRLEKIILGERKIFDREKELTRDYREATFLLSLPASSNCGLYTIPSFSLGYSYFQGKNEIKSAAKSKAIKVSKVPIIVTSSLEKDVVTIGEVNAMRLTIWREKYIRILNKELGVSESEVQKPENESFARWLKSLEVRGQKISDLNKPAFGRFKLLSKKILTESHNSAQKETFEYRFSFYEHAPLETPIPDFHIWYLNESLKEKQTPKEITVSPRYILINSVLNPNRKSIEWLKPPEPNRKNNVYYFGYGPMALGGIFFLIFAVSITVSCIRSRKQKIDSSIVSESPYEIRNRILSELEADKLTWERGTLIETRNEIFKLFGSITGIPANISMAKTNSQMLMLLEQIGFPKDQLENIKSSLMTLDKIIQHYDTVIDPEPARELINNILTNPGILHFLKKRKFWNFRS